MYLLFLLLITVTVCNYLFFFHSFSFVSLFILFITFGSCLVFIFCMSVSTGSIFYITKFNVFSSQKSKYITLCPQHLCKEVCHSLAFKFGSFVSTYCSEDLNKIVPEEHGSFFVRTCRFSFLFLRIPVVVCNSIGKLSSEKVQNG